MVRLHILARPINFAGYFVAYSNTQAGVGESHIRNSCVAAI